MVLKNSSRSRRDAVPDGCRILHEWFAGWRWEQYHHGVLVHESLQSFATEEECVADADLHRERAVTSRCAA